MDPRLLDAARQAMAKAYVPNSKFKVGAAILGDDGIIYAGCNVENASYPEGWCAETSAIAAMVLAGVTKIREIAVIGPGDQLTTPCGGCRQRIAEFATAETPVHICGAEGLRRSFKLGELLPAAFAQENLG